MGNPEELIAIPVSEYQYLKQCEYALMRRIEHQIHDLELDMQMMQIDTMIKSATPPGIKTKQL